MTDRIRSGVLCLHDQKILAIELKDPSTGERNWSFPGGAIEANESPEECAVRETLEETGYEVQLIGPAFINRYIYHWDGRDRHCETHWFRAQLKNQTTVKVDDAAYILRNQWLPWPDSRPYFDYHSALIEAIDKLL